MGPTAAGKTEAAIRLCEAFPFEIVSVDSSLVYRRLVDWERISARFEVPFQRHLEFSHLAACRFRRGASARRCARILGLHR